MAACIQQAVAQWQGSLSPD